MSVKSDAIALCAPFGRLLENEALSNRKRTSNCFQFKNGHRQRILIHNNTDLVAQFGQRKMIQNASSIQTAPSSAKARPHFRVSFSVELRTSGLLSLLLVHTELRVRLLCRRGRMIGCRYYSIRVHLILNFLFNEFSDTILTK